MLDWQRTLLVICSMAFVLACRLSKTCAENGVAVEHLAYVVVGGIFGGAIPGITKHISSNKSNEG